MRLFSLFIGLLGLALTGPARAADGAERLSWLAGCWSLEGGEPGSGEQWLPAAGGTLLGVSRTVRGGNTVAHEFMQIRPGADGNLVFIAQPSGKPEGSFGLLTGTNPAEAIFENLQHDFPQRVIYRLEDGGRLRARIEGQRNGTQRGVDFPLQRVACDPPPAAPEAFQGLPWGAGEAQLLQRFGAMLKPAECPATAARRLRPREACNSPMLAPYDVAGVPFRLNLLLDERTRRLVRVALAWDGVVAASGSDNAFSEKHRLLRQLLTQRYGAPESTHVDSDPAAWNATARWRRGETLIELVSTFVPRASGSSAREQVEIVYLPVTGGDAGKL